MDREKKVTLGPGREAVVKPELEARPPLEPVVAAVRLVAPWWPGAQRRKTIQFLDALLAAFRVRARDEPDLEVVEEGARVVVRRTLGEGRTEVRYERESRTRGTFYCDHRELENLYALGILKGARVYRPRPIGGGEAPPAPADANDRG
ncbi:MAG: hypothetical protein JSU81_00205 [Candidatus Coatesbacteria bacterium]|nr:MAG: hypothetical protein JSU81_00205 [Candidatus Coatesbacteria bacterium]